MPAPGSIRGYLISAVLNTFMLMKHEGGNCFDDIRILLQESELMNLLGLSYLLIAKTLGNWLRRFGSCKPSMRALGEVNKLHAPHCRRVMLIPITEGKRPVGTMSECLFPSVAARSRAILSIRPHHRLVSFLQSHYSWARYQKLPSPRKSQTVNN